jgi:hypothetical protein
LRLETTNAKGTEMTKNTKKTEAEKMEARMVKMANRNAIHRSHMMSKLRRGEVVKPVPFIIGK